MRMNKKLIMVLLTTTALLAGCGVKGDRKAVEETAEITYFEATVLEMADQMLLVEPMEVEGTGVGILAHIKEVHEDEILISSDSNDFPGAFRVEVPETVFNITKLSGGASIQILMQKKEEKESAEIPEYLAKNIVLMEEQEDVVPINLDVLFTEPPAITLSDPLSSTCSSFEIQAGNYSWNWKDGGEMTGVVACGVHPMDGFEREKLKLPDYQNMSAVNYIFSAATAPDILKISKWNAIDIGNTEAEEVSVITYYYQMPVVELEPGSVYEFTASWKEENLNQRGFYGEASYTLVTE